MSDDVQPTSPHSDHSSSGEKQPLTPTRSTLAPVAPSTPESPPGPSDAALVIDGLTIRHGARTVLDAVTFTAAAGQVTALIGPNGAGKSTLITSALGLVPSDHGRVRLLGQDLLAMDRRARARLVGYVPQRSRLSAPLLVRDVVAHGRYALGGGLSGLLGANRAAVDEALSAVDGMGLAARRFNELSAGEAQRVLVARALAGGAHTVLLENPTAALDIGHALSLLALLRRLASNGCIVLVALHQLDEVRRVADHAVLLHAGRVTITGSPETVLASPQLTAAFGVETDPAGALAFRLASSRTAESP